MSSKILFVDNSSRCFYIFRMPVAKAFKQAGYEVCVMTPLTDEYSQNIEREGIKHVTYPLKSKFSPMEDMKLLLFLRKQYKKLKPDYIIHYTIKPNIYGSIAARINKIPSLAVVPGTGSVFSKKGLVSSISAILYKIAFRFPQKIWVLNRDDRQSFLQKRIVKPEKIEILPGEGVNTNYFKANAEYHKHVPFVFLYMGRMLREKGVEHIAEAVRMLHRKGIRNFEVRLLGLVDGLSKDVISEKEIRQWESEKLVRFLGSVADVRPDIEAADCVLLPTFYGEGVPRSLMEACAMERMILATDNVGCRDIVQDGCNGVLCKPKSVEDLALKMERVLSMPEQEIKSMGMNGRKKVIAEFDERKIVECYLKEISF